MSQLAKNYAVCDRWFGSVPCETWPNRSFLHAGTSFGRLNNCNGKYTEDCIPNLFVYAGQRTIFDVLDEQGIRWGVYQDAVIVGTLLSFQFWTLPQKLSRSAGDLFYLKNALASARTPQYIFVEPSFGADPNHQHPPHKVASGETLIQKVYTMLVESDVWHKTLLVILHDEHGGCYDHIPPPQAIPPDNHEPQFQVGGLNPFAIYGPRVPAVLVSPYIEPGTVLRAPPGTEFDHTSILASLRDWIFQGKPDILGNNARIRNAPVVWPALTRTTARSDRPAVRAAVDSARAETTTFAARQVENVAMAEAERILVTEATGDADAVTAGWRTRLAELAEEKRRELEEGRRPGELPTPLNEVPRHPDA